MLAHHHHDHHFHNIHMETPKRICALFGIPTVSTELKTQQTLTLNEAGDHCLLIIIIIIIDNVWESKRASI